MKIAVIQLSAGNNKAINLVNATRLIEEAFDQKAESVFLPEVFNYRCDTTTDEVKLAAEIIPDGSTTPLIELARKYKGYIFAGSILERMANRVYNTSIVISPAGKIIRKYRKIHLFKAKLGDKIINEGKSMKAGTLPATVKVDNFNVGLSICYDLRFADLYATYRRKRVDIITVPSSFTYKTGQAHWEVLLRARAIENLAYVIAANQSGTTPDGVRTYGNSMVISPWGEVIARAGEKLEEIIYADIDRKSIVDARNILPGIVNK